MNNSIMNVNAERTMTSREIAELTGKMHKNVIADIEKMSKDLGCNLSPALKSTTYTDANGIQRKQYELNYRMTMTLITGYSSNLRYAVVGRWQELEEEKQVQQPQLPSTYIDALECLLESKKAEARLVEQNQALEDDLNTASTSHQAILQAEQMATDEMAFRTFCKVFVGMKEKDVKAKLHQAGVFMQTSRCLPYQKYVDAEWFNTRSNGFGGKQIVFTSKGAAICKIITAMDTIDSSSVSVAAKIYRRGIDYDARPYDITNFIR